MHRSVVDGDRADTRPNVLPPIGNATFAPGEGCLTLVSLWRNLFRGKPFGDVGRRRSGRFSPRRGPICGLCRPVLESWHGNLVSYKELEQVPRSFR